ncbi:MAG: SGNH/GDSL hydrolase family protein [Clostridia bacterium]|nr:SGNH/GDSL hydrolase family protein [Clostridia bacterium]
MDWNKYFYDETEKPLDHLVTGYSRTSIFRTMAFIGDSLSSGEFETRDKDGKTGYHDMFEYSWGQFIARKNGIKAYNFSRGGMTASEYIESFADSMGYFNPDLKAQAYVIALGVNDIYNRHYEIGSVDDVDVNNHENNKKTFLGYYGKIISKYKEISPDAKFFLVTFPDEQKLKEETLAVIDAFYKLSEKFTNTFVIDLYKYGPTYNDAFREKCNLYWHLSPAGYVFTAEMIDSYIDYIIRHNPASFREVGFINSGIKYKQDED